MKATILTIGDEILNGDITDTNATYISRQLQTIGIKVVHRVTVGDVRKDILQAFQDAMKGVNLVLITGGLGPTQDDLTKECFADFFQLKLVENKALRQKIETYYQSRGRSLDVVSKKMVDLPKGCIILENNYGVAPGMWVKKEQCVFVALPGVPFEMKGILNDIVLPKIQEEFELPFIYSHYFNTVGQGEVTLEKRLLPLIEQLPSNFNVAFLPSFHKVTIRISASGENEEELLNQFSHYLPLFRAELNDELYSEVKNESLVEVIAKVCLSKNITVSTAESCTGGAIAKRMVSIAGSSAYYQGSVVAYHNEIKQSILGVKESTLDEFGAVSEQTVKEMVQGVLLKTGSDVAVATSGIAGPTGGTEQKPVGQICIAVGNSKGMTSKTFTFAKNREKNIQIFTTTALNMLLKFIQEEQ